MTQLCLTTYNFPSLCKALVVIFGPTFYQTLVGFYDIPGSHSSLLQSVMYSGILQTTLQKDWLFCCLLYDDITFQVQTTCKCLNTPRTIYILSSGSKEAGSSETSSLTFPHCILVYAKIAVCIVS